jgi:hypothetical protein
MPKQRRRAALTALLAVALAALGLAASAPARLAGPFTVFAQCPYKSAGTEKCFHSVIESGEVMLGKKKVPIEKAVTLQGGLGKLSEGFAPMISPTSGVTLSKAPQNVPGGLAGIVPDESSPPLVKALTQFFFENSITGLTSTLELAKPVDEVKVSERHLAEGIGVAIKIPVQVHLENPFLGNHCYVGSSSSPITWELTTGVTRPPGPNNKPIKGSAGHFEFLEEGLMLETEGLSLVDDAWPAPGASGCGGILAFLVNPIVNAQLGATTSGHNTAILTGTAAISSALAVQGNDEENP